jgi:hypothetical protein
VTSLDWQRPCTYCTYTSIILYNVYNNTNILTRHKTWQRLPTNDRSTLSSERAPQEDKDRNSHYIGLQNLVMSPRSGSTPRLTDWPSVVTWLWLWLLVTSVALMMGTETVPETSASFNVLTWLIARNDFIKNLNFTI